MNIQTVKQNLRNTIEGKETLLNTYTRLLPLASNRVQQRGTTERIFMLSIDIDELKRILADLEKCVEIPERLA
jgi:endonuclease V-like protein UPF0215 family